MRLLPRLATLSFFVAFASPSALRAQHVAALAPAPDSTPVTFVTPSIDTVTPPATAPSDRVQSGAPLTGMRAGVHARETVRTLHPTIAATRANLGQSRAMMIVGVAALITGAIIGGDPGTIIMVGGAVVGLYGLYQYLQ